MWVLHKHGCETFATGGGQWNSGVYVDVAYQQHQGAGGWTEAGEDRLRLSSRVYPASSEQLQVLLCNCMLGNPELCTGAGSSIMELTAASLL